MYRQLKLILGLSILLLSILQTACFTPSSEETTTSTTATKAANITITETALQSGERNAITTTNEGDYLLSAQTIEAVTLVAVTLYNTGDIAAEKIKAYSLSTPLGYAGGSYPGTGGTCTTKIPSQASCTIVLSYSPTKMGTNSSTLQLGYYNGKTTRVFEKIFKGTGVSNPTITSVSPSAGKVAGGGTLTISGNQIYSGALVTVGGNSCTITNYYEPTAVSCILPAHSPASTDITVMNTDGRRSTMTGAYTYQYAPTITSISPAYGSIGGGDTILINGTGFLTGVIVEIGGQSCATLTRVSTTQLSCVTPSHALGSVNITVTNADGQYAESTNGFSYAPPTITSLSSSSGSTNGFATVQINGTGFLTGASVSFGGIPATLTSLSATQLTVTTPAHPSGLVDVVVTNSYDGQSGTASNAYTYSTTANEGWTSMTTVGAPTGWGSIQISPWTGSKLAVWGSGQRYYFFDPATDSWSFGSSGNGAIVNNYSVSAWTDKYLVTFGTYYGNTGARYDPVADSWLTMPTTNAPDGPPGWTSSHIPWTGKYLVFYEGGYNQGALYDPDINAWMLMSTTTTHTGYSHFSTVWTGKKVLVFGGWNSGVVNTGAAYDPATNTWSNITTTGAPYQRWLHDASWTGSKMIVFGGDTWGNNWVNTGGMYDPETDSWTSTSTTDAPLGRGYHTQVWTGSKMLAWGGTLDGNLATNTGGIFDPLTNTWTSMLTLAAPPSALSSTGVWTGSNAIFWGGGDAVVGSLRYTGGVYTPPSSPSANSWSAITTTGAPSPRHRNSQIWTGSEMIVWGGGWSPFTNDGASYNPVTNSWTTIATVSLAIRLDQAAVWTGSKMMIWGGSENSNIYNDGALYDPGTNSWTSISTTAAPSPRSFPTLVWTGSKAILWGGSGLNTGGLYNPETDTWTAMSTTNIPSPWLRGIWTGNKMFIYSNLRAYTYDPSSDLWNALATTNSTVATVYSAIAWTGTKAIIWGGVIGSGKCNTGGVYDLTSNVWTSMTTIGAPEPRYRVGGVWTGKHFFVFGGDTGASSDIRSNTGGLYDPVTNQWTLSTTTGAPNPREFTHNLVWTGKSVITWGGPWVGFLNSGGVFTPP